MYFDGEFLTNLVHKNTNKIVVTNLDGPLKYLKNEWKFKGDKPCIIDFYADWCQPCKMLSPILDDLSKEYHGRVDFYKVDTELEQKVSGAFGVRSIPTMLFIPMNEKPQMLAGFLDKKTLGNIINDVLIVS